jgi:hypothetical protein
MEPRIPPKLCLATLSGSLDVLVVGIVRQKPPWQTAVPQQTSPMSQRFGFGIHSNVGWLLGSLLEGKLEGRLEGRLEGWALGD